MGGRRTYYLLKTTVRKERVLLVAFHEHPMKGSAERKRNATLHVLSRQDFEQGLNVDARGHEPALALTVMDGAMPPWLQDLEGRDLDAEPAMLMANGKSQRSPRDEVVDRLVRIRPAIDAMDNIFAADHPDIELNKFARKSLPTQTHGTRFRLWVYLYLVFDRRMWVLLPPRFRCGRWDRLLPKYEHSLPGRPSEEYGCKYNHRTTQDMINKIVMGIQKRITQRVDPFPRLTSSITTFTRSSVAMRSRESYLEMSGCETNISPTWARSWMACITSGSVRIWMLPRFLSVPKVTS